MTTLLGSTLRRYRERVRPKVSQKQLGLFLAVHHTTVSKIEGGTMFPSDEYIERFLTIPALTLNPEEQAEIRTLYNQASQSRGDKGRFVGLDWREWHRRPWFYFILGLSVVVLGGVLFLWWRAGNTATVAVRSLDLDAYCTSQGFTEAVLVSSSSTEYMPYAWRCDGVSGPQIIDLSLVCRQLYGNDAPYAVLVDTENPYSWACYNTTLVDYQNGWCGAIPLRVQHGEVGSASFYPRLYFDAHINTSALVDGEYYVYYRGIYQQNTLKRRGDDPNPEGWQFDVESVWAQQGSNRDWENISLWRLDYRCKL